MPSLANFTFTMRDHQMLIESTVDDMFLYDTMHNDDQADS
jgi:hypothetical protein